MAIEFIYSTTGHKNRILPNSQIRSFVFYGATFKKGIRMATRAIKKSREFPTNSTEKNIFFSLRTCSKWVKKRGWDGCHNKSGSRQQIHRYIDPVFPK